MRQAFLKTNVGAVWFMREKLRKKPVLRIRKDWLELAHGKTAPRRYCTRGQTQQTRASPALYGRVAQRRFHTDGVRCARTNEVFFDEPRTGNANHAQSTYGGARSVRDLPARRRRHQSRASCGLRT